MGVGPRRREVGPRPIQRQFERSPPRLRVPLPGCQLAPRRGLLARGLRLLKLDVFAFETPSHSKYCIGMPPLDVTALRTRVRASLRFDTAAFASAASDSDRVARGLWRRDPSAWTADASV